jgi:hypothetical protein
MVQHFHVCHPASSWVYAQQQDKYEPEHVRHVVVGSASPVVTRLKVGADAFVGLALRQPGSIVTSLETAQAYAAVFANFLAHATFGEPRGDTIGAAVLHWRTWIGVCVFLSCVACPCMALVPH